MTNLPSSDAVSYVRHLLTAELESIQRPGKELAAFLGVVAAEGSHELSTESVEVEASTTLQLGVIARLADRLLLDTLPDKSLENTSVEQQLYLF